MRRLGFIHNVAAWTLLLPLPLLIIPTKSWAGEFSCTVEQITNTKDVWFERGAFSQSGRWFVTQKLSGQAPVPEEACLMGFSAGEVFLFDSATSELTRLTEMSACSLEPKISGDGRWLLYESVAYDFGLRFEHLVLLDRVTQQEVSVTPASRSGTRGHRVNSDGSSVYFVSTRDLTGSNPDLSAQIFRWDRATDTTTQLTQFTGAASNLTYSGQTSDFSTLLLQSRFDPFGLNPDGMNEVFTFHVPTGVLTQITETADGWSEAPSISADGDKILFRTTPSTSGNPGQTFDLMLYDVSDEEVTVLDPRIADPIYGILSADGRRFVDTNFSFIEARIVDLPSGDDALLGEGAKVGQSVFPWAISDDGELVLMSATADLTGQNADHNFEIFLAHCPRPTVFDDGFESGDLTMWSLIMP